jgi:hypothetical protein
VTGQYAVVWREGKELYTHSDANGTILFSLEELLQDEVPRWENPVWTVAPEDGKVAVLAEDLNEFLGI